jgi:serine/threonine protein kinase
MYYSNKLNDQINITHDKLGKGSFGSVYKAIYNNKEIAIKCETKEKNNSLSLLREFKICRKIFMITKYLTFKELLSKEDNNNEENKSILADYLSNNNIIIHRHINDNDILLIPNELKENWNIRFIPEMFSYIECNDYNFLTMELCEDNFENILDKNNFDEDSKYQLAYYLLNIMSYIHSCGIIHRDIKLSNFVIDKNNKPRLIDLGLSKEYYKYENNKVLPINSYQIKSITGTIRYISLNIHALNSPNINDDLISLCYCLVVILTGKNLPWIGHKKDTAKFEIDHHTHENCNCGYHKNKKNNNLKLNTIAEIKYHTSLEELTEYKYPFLLKWIKYLYSLKSKQMPSYNLLLKILSNEYNNFKDIKNFKINLIKKNSLSKINSKTINDKT